MALPNVTFIAEGRTEAQRIEHLKELRARYQKYDIKEQNRCATFFRGGLRIKLRAEVANEVEAFIRLLLDDEYEALSIEDEAAKLPQGPGGEIVTREMIDSVMTPPCGLSRVAAAWLGVPYPLRSGWAQRILGKPRCPISYKKTKHKRR